MRERTRAYRVLAEQQNGKGPLGRPSCRWENNIKMALQEIGWGGDSVDRIVLAQEMDKWWTLVNSVMNLGVPSNLGNFLTELLLPCHEGLFSIDVDSCKTFFESALQKHWTKSK